MEEQWSLHWHAAIVPEAQWVPDSMIFLTGKDERSLTATVPDIPGLLFFSPLEMITCLELHISDEAGAINEHISTITGRLDSRQPELSR